MEDPPNEQISDKRQKLDDDDSAFLETPDDASAMKAFTNQALQSSNSRGTVQQQEIVAVFGQTPGHTGSGSLDIPSVSAAETGHSEEQPSELEPGIVAVEDRTQPGDQEGTDAALRAAHKARMRGSSDDAVLDALEAAETAYDTSHTPSEPVGSMNRRLSSKLDSGEVPHSPPAHIGRNGGKKGSAVDEGVRQKVRLKFIGAMQRNAALALLNPAEIEGRAAELEEACQSSSSSRPVYNSKAGNMSRLLGKASDLAELEELPRIASGLQKEVAAGKVAEAFPVGEGASGLLRIALK